MLRTYYGAATFDRTGRLVLSAECPHELALAYDGFLWTDSGFVNGPRNPPKSAPHRRGQEVADTTPAG